MRRLVIFINGDFTLRENGSQVRMAEQVEFASRHFADVAVYSHRQHPSHPWTDLGKARFAAMFPSVELIVEHLSAHVRLATRIKNAGLAIFPGAARHILQFVVPGGPPRYRAMRARDDLTLWINYVDGCSILNGLPTSVILETHDVRFVKEAKRFGTPTYALRMVGKMRSEVAVLAHAGAAITISPVDRQIFEALAPQLRMFLVPSFVESAAPVREPDTVPSFDMLFVGSGNQFNVDGLVDFLAQNREWLARHSILVAGRICESAAVQAAVAGSSNVRLLGFVEDLAPVYASARIVLSPVDGTGLKIKVVDALAHGKPVVGSRHSRDALPTGYESCVLPADRAHIDALLDDPRQLAAAERAAQEYYVSFREAGERSDLLAFLTQTLSGPSPHVLSG